MTLHAPETPTSQAAAQATSAGADAALDPEETMSRDELEAMTHG